LHTLQRNSIIEFQEAHKLLQPADKTLKELAVELAEYQVYIAFSWFWFRLYFFVQFKLRVDFLWAWWTAYYWWVKYNSFVMLQVCVDLFVTTQTYADIASISTIPRTTGGQVYINA